MAKLKLLVGRWGSIVLYQVLEQDESLQSDGDMKTLYYEQGFKITSAYHPWLLTKNLCLRGNDRSKDNFQALCRCNDVAEAEELIAKIKTGVAAINAEPWDTDITEHTLPLEIVE